MNQYATHVKNTLFQLIHEMAEHSYLFSQNPERDFSRNRKLGFEKLIKFLLSMEGGTLSKELLEYFGYATETATVSALNQQRHKLLSETLEYLFHEFNTAFHGKKKYKGYTLLACDGSDLSIPVNSEDKDTYKQNREGEKGYNLLHLNAIYDVLERRYTDVLIQTVKKKNECRAMADMIDRSKIKGNSIIMADRGYESYNLFAHAEKKKWNYLIRAKDINSNGIISSIAGLKDDEFDITIEKTITKKQTNEVKKSKDKYTIIPSGSTFDYLDLSKNKFYPMTLRIVRFKLTETTYECIITNLSKAEFPPSTIKELYHMRWGIETSFRELKYAIGLSNFHAKKVDYILQEIYARMIMYNYCELITTHVIVKQKVTKHTYQVNYTMAIHICRYFLKTAEINPPNVEALIQKYILPIREGRHDPRKVKVQSSVSFIYRIA